VVKHHPKELVLVHHVEQEDIIVLLVDLLVLHVLLVNTNQVEDKDTV